MSEKAKSDDPLVRAEAALEGLQRIWMFLYMMPTRTYKKWQKEEKRASKASRIPPMEKSVGQGMLLFCLDLPKH